MDPLEDRSFCPRTRREKAFQAAWEELVDRYGATLRSQVRRALLGAGLRPSDDLVEERVQEVYYRLLLGGPGRLRLLRRWSDGRAVSYLCRMAERVVVDEVRAKAAVKRGGDWGLWWDDGLPDIAEHAVDPRGTPEEQALLSERRRLVLRGCRRMVRSMMDEEDRGRCLRVLRLALLEGWSSSEIVRAERGALAASTVDTLVHRARRRLARGGVKLPNRRPGPSRPDRPGRPGRPGSPRALISSPP
jgi:DNA-directed RNA polymerase specialized sigma24 family protein